MILVSCSKVELGTSRALPELLLTRVDESGRTFEGSRAMNLNNCEGSLGSNSLYLRMPSRATALSPSSSHFIQ